MKIAVVSYNGSCGKTTTSTYLVAPRLPNAKFFSVETINQSASDLGIEDVTSFRGEDFPKLIEDVIFEDAAVIDIGASNIESFLTAMSRFDGGANEFDMYIIPVVPDDKSITEGLRTAHTLSKAGVDNKKIVFIPNRVNPGDDVEYTFAPVFDFVKKMKVGKINKEAVIYKSDVYEYLAHYKMSFETLIAEDAEEFKARAKASTDADERRKMARRYTYMKQAIPVKNNLDKTFSLLIGG
ncbi:StdB protein [Salmonella enterica subsp. enterica serovar Telelkebir]|nr:StdB protein [Salmonella enterica subsp. enterica serovar Telelkebir]ECB6713982.1 StdB protein [Salmonella enterica subsp. enterica serovar Hvittingfoss]ELT8232584.1 StdB protein [Salmonella enterica]